MFKYKIIGLALILCSLYGFTPQSTSLADLEITEQSYSEQISYFANIYGADSSLVKRVVDNESGGKHNVKCGDGGRSCGIAQIQIPTWKDLEQKYNLEFAEDLNYNSQFDQLKIITWGIARGYGNKWTAYRCIMNGGKYSFYSSQLKKHFTVYCKL